MKNNIKILALDQSTSCTGYAIGKNNQLIDSGHLKIKSANLDEMIDLIINLINQEKPKLILIEDIFYSPNGGKSFSTLARLQGIIIGICKIKKIDYQIVNARSWKKKFGIKAKKRNDQKKECQAIVKEKFDKDVNTDEADSIGILNYVFD